MTIGIPEIPMDCVLVDSFTNFLEASSKKMNELRKTVCMFEEITDSYCVCDALVTSRGTLKVHMLNRPWLKLASVSSQNLCIKSRYVSGPEAEKPWSEHLFCLSFEHQGVKYFTLMSGDQIDREGIEIADKDELLRGVG